MRGGQAQAQREAQHVEDCEAAIQQLAESLRTAIAEAASGKVGGMNADATENSTPTPCHSKRSLTLAYKGG